MLTFTLVLVLVFSLMVKFLFSKKGLPGKFQNLLENFYELLEGLFEQLTGDKTQAKIVIPTVGSILVFIGLSNFLGHIPGLSSITLGEHHLFRSATSDFNTTFSIALIAVIGIQIIGFKQNGFLGYLGHFFKFKDVYLGFKKGLGEGAISLITFFVGILELFSELIKVISLSLRLFGNIFAGKIIMSILISSFAYILPSVWLGMEFLVAVVQALVFSSLITVYYTLVLKHEEKH
jgi:F-type H+-transporting ATPase subunit a